jgi:hypothetical protein
MKEKVLRKMYSLEQNKLPTNEIFPEGNFYNSFSEYIRDNSILLNEAVIFQGKVNSCYGYDIDSNVNNPVVMLGNETFRPAVKIFNRDDFIPKSFGLEIVLPHRADELDEKTEERIITNVIYKPMLKAIEKQCISGGYFHKPLFNTANTISGSGFSGLLELARVIKNNTDNGIIVIHPAIMESILDNSMTTEYKAEYLMRNTVENVPVLQTIESPINYEDKFAVAFNKSNIVLSLADEVSVKKFYSLNSAMDYFYHIIAFCNFSDLYGNSIALKM